MPILLIVTFCTIAGLLLLRAWPSLDTKQKTQWVLVSVAALLGVMAITGRMHWIGVLVAGLAASLRGLIPVLIRLLPLLQQQFQRHSFTSKTQQEQESEVNTAILSMRLDHETGELSGEVLSGPFSGKQLNTLTLTQCQQLLNYCEQEDQASVDLLNSYLEQRFGEPYASADQEDTKHSSSIEMNTREALDVLGLEEGATREEIMSAHKKLIQKMHPDRGGSTYLASKINQAKDILLG
jgi:hypothetical protein